MNYSDEEVELIVGWTDVRKAYVAAKQNRVKDPETYEEAKAKMGEMRTEWRTIREAFPAETADEDGTPAPLSISAEATPAEIAKATKEAGN